MVNEIAAKLSECSEFNTAGILREKFADNTRPALTLTASGELSGLGFADVVVKIAAAVNPTAICGNPGSKQTQAQDKNHCLSR